MKRILWLMLLLAPTVASAAEPVAVVRLAEFRATVAPLLKTHCIACHGPDTQEGDVRLDHLFAETDFNRQTRTLQAMRDQLRDGLMPPPDEPRPDDAQVRAAVATLTAMSGSIAPRLPNEGNLVPHELLFGKPADEGQPSAQRIWRLSPDGYLGFVREVHRGRHEGIVQPFSAVPERGIKDFAQLYAIDQSSTEVLVRNAAAIVAGQTLHEIKDGKVHARHDTVGEFVKLMDPQMVPTREQLQSAVKTQFRLAIGRAPDEPEIARFIALYEKCAAAGDHPAAVKVMLQAVLLKAEAMYRWEMGGNEGGVGPRMLAPAELVRALSLSIGNRRDGELMKAAEKGELSTKEQIATHVRSMLDDPKGERNARVLKFFREYFEYDKAVDVFKDKPNDLMHEPRQLVADTDRLVQYIVEQDRDVLRELLTTPKSFVNLVMKENKQTRKHDVPTRAVVPNPHNNKGQAVVESLYGLTEWTEHQPVTLPENTRLGILMQPSWLVAWSTNFDNDPVRRGRWVRERLLGGTVPDLPIGVVAQVPDDPHRTYRDRLTVTRAAQCWKCHQQMDELGLPLENFDHYGRFRLTEKVRDLDATAANVDKKGNPLGPVTREVDLITTGHIARSGDAKLDGDVRDPRELVRKLADSERVRQVFVRHAFRFFLGRNESLADAHTLQQADRAYVASGGSFKALVVSLLTSDSFLYRTSTAENSAVSLRELP